MAVQRDNRLGIALASMGAAAVAAGASAWAAGVRLPDLIGLSAVAGAVSLAAGFALPTYLEGQRRRQDERVAVERAFDAAVLRLPTTAPIGPVAVIGRSPAELLRADTQAVPFFGRRGELRGLATWVDSRAHGRVRLITGAAVSARRAWRLNSPAGCKRTHSDGHRDGVAGCFALVAVRELSGLSQRQANPLCW